MDYIAALEVSPISPLTKEDLSVTDRSDKLVALLERSRHEGGYGGRINYTEFASLGASLGWAVEDVEDCWYDILKGVAVPYSEDMERVALTVCSYCLAGPSSSLVPPLLENNTCREGKDKDLFAAEGSSIIHAVSQTVVDTIASPCLESQGQNHAPPPEIRETVKHSPHHRKSTTGAPASVIMAPRFAEPTASSMHRKRLGENARTRVSSSSPLRLRAERQTQQGEVFNRLYTHAQDLEQRRKAAREAAVAATSEEEQDYFSPKITQYKGLSKDRGKQYNKSTQSFYSKLIASERHYDPIAESPATPRPQFCPPPGPSMAVPSGYVESVARLRHSAATRRCGDFADSLRSSSPRINITPTRRSAAEPPLTYSSPILRLPFTHDNGTRDIVDVRLAKNSSSTQHHPLV